MTYIDEPAREVLLKHHPEVVLYCPQIPQNTGTISRLCAAFSSTLHLIHPMAFEITEKAVKRAGLDYWKHVNLFEHESWKSFRDSHKERRIVFVETGGTQSPYEFEFHPQDLLVFGAETFGIHKDVMESEIQNGNCHFITIPMFNRGVRSINLANTVSIVLYLAIAQLHSKGTKQWA
jgi:tRNA (cytidine/uridine-2'-O-)-methyltransferase